MNIRIDTSEIDKLYKTLNYLPKELPAAIASSLNKTLTSTNSQLQKQISKKYNIEKKDLSSSKKYKSEKSNNLITIKKANYKNMSAYITVRGPVLTLSRFLVSPKSPVSFKGKTMRQIKKIRRPTVNVVRAKISTITKKHNAFVAKNGEHLAIFERTDNGSISMLRTTSVAQMAGDKDIAEEVSKHSETMLSKKIQQEIKYRIIKAQKQFFKG